MTSVLGQAPGHHRPGSFGERVSHHHHSHNDFEGEAAGAEGVCIRG